MLSELHLRDVGPAPALDVEFAERLNIFTGDNGLGKTFLLDCAWWALTHSWPGPFALPRPGSRDARIGFFYTPAESTGQEPPYTKYNYRAQQWWRGYGNSGQPAIYARADGGVSVFEPLHEARWLSSGDSQHLPQEASLHFDTQTLWYGLRPTPDDGRVLCNGIVDDLILWQFSPERDREDSPFATFARLLNRLSHPDEPVKFGMPAKPYLNDRRQYPTIVIQHGQEILETLPIHLAPAGLKRILGLAYLMVWAWFEHRSLAALVNQEPAGHLDVLIDEVELHLHPKWQRSILPSLLAIGADLHPGTSTQFLVTTHSPLVLASVEPAFDEERDRLFLFDVEEGRVALNEVPWTRQGDASLWLTSSIFGLAQARSREAEAAILAANALMRGDLAELPEGLRTKEQIHEELCRVLPGHDRFWPRWIVQDPVDNDDQVRARAGAAGIR